MLPPVCKIPKRIKKRRRNLRRCARPATARDGRGNATLGAPDLTDDVWLYGNSREQILESFVAGRQGEMPAQKTRMDPARIRLLAAWIATGAINDYPPK